MIKVYVRESEEAIGRLLGHFPPESIDALVNLFNRYRTFLESAEAECVFFHARFVEQEGEVVFEIVVDKDND